MSKKTILIVEDEEAIREMVKFSFFKSKFILEEAADVKQARKKMLIKMPDLVLIDWMMPGTNGIEFAKELRSIAETQWLPIIMLTAKSDEKDKILSLSIGVDDYVVKPFSTKELIARIKAVLRRSEKIDTKFIYFSDLALNKENQQITTHGKKMNLGPLDYKLLAHFITHPNKVYSREKLLDKVWGKDTYPDERTVDVQIRRLRKILKKFDQEYLLQTVRGSGYRFSTDE